MSVVTKDTTQVYCDATNWPEVLLCAIGELGQLKSS